MKREVEIRASARTDILEIISFVAMDNPDAADRLNKNLDEGIAKLYNTPAMGVPDKELSLLTNMDVRRLYISRYVVIYALREDKACVYHVSHQKRELDSVGMALGMLKQE